MEILIIVLIVFYIVIFYFLKMRPEKQRKKEMEAMKRSLAPGDAVTMIDGIVGNICAVRRLSLRPVQTVFVWSMRTGPL